MYKLWHMLQVQDYGEKVRKMPNSKANMVFALGGNLTSSYGSPLLTLGKAAEIMAARGAVIRAASRFYRTPAFPAGNGPDYVNAALAVSANWSPQNALENCHMIEAHFGRARDVRWGQRTLDIDLIAYEDRVLPDQETQTRWRDLPLETQMKETPSQLIVPHPRMQDRAFVLVPMADVAPDWRHPVLGQTVTELLAALPQADKDAVQPLD